jgi:hypothetical protein
MRRLLIGAHWTVIPHLHDKGTLLVTGLYQFIPRSGVYGDAHLPRLGRPRQMQVNGVELRSFSGGIHFFFLRQNLSLAPVAA